MTSKTGKLAHAITLACSGVAKPKPRPLWIDVYVRELARTGDSVQAEKHANKELSQ